MHDPSTLLFDVRPIRLDIWHDEPGGHDSGTVCGPIPMPVGARMLWATRHVRHLHYRFWPYLRVRRWIRDHCDECGRRFLWKDSRHGYMGSDAVYHDQCMSLRSARNNLNDLTAHVRGTSDWDTNWRAKYRLERLALAERKTLDPEICCQEPTCPDYGSPDFGEGTCPAEHAEVRS